MAKAPRNDETADERSPAETERIREATLKKILSTPPKPHKDMVGKTAPKSSGAVDAGPKKRLRDQIKEMPAPLGDLKLKLRSA